MKRRPALFSWIAVLAVWALAAVPVVAQDEDRSRLTFGSLVDQSASGSTLQLMGLIEQEIRELFRRDYEIAFPESKALDSDWTREGITRDLKALLADPEVDVVLVIGPISTASLCCLGELPKPVFAPLGVDGEALGLPSNGDSSGVRNLNYLSNPGSSFRDLEKFAEIVGFERVHVISDPLIYEVLAELYERNRMMFEPLGIKTLAVNAISSAQEVLDEIPEDAQAAYFTPLLRMTDVEKQKLIDGLNARKIPTMSLLGRTEVEMGILAGQRAPANYPRMARRIALNVQRALFGEDPGTFSITFEPSERLVINMDTARKIGLYPTWRVLTDAELLNEDIPTANQLTLSQAVNNALAANRQILAAQRLVSAGGQAVREVRAEYLPQLDASIDSSRIDEDRAQFRAEGQTTAGATLSQVVWSDPLRTGIRIERDFQTSREQVLVETELDVAADAASAFLDVLRSQNLEGIERDNLRRVETNLELARNRVKVGAANFAELYRWEVERANGKSAVIQAGRILDVTRVRVNQLMYRPQEEPFATEEPDLERDPHLVVSSEKMAPFYNDPWSFRVFRNFMVEYALDHSPELQQLQAAIDAQRRSYRLAKRSFWSPTIGFQADYDGVLQESADSSAIGFKYPDQSWTVGLSVGLPLYTGGRRQATTLRNQDELDALERDYENLSDLTELRTRTALFSIAASWSNIDLSREAAEASRKNLDLVTDSYAKGAISIQDLLDAQNAALTSELRAANAVYNFLLDLVEVQRASGRLEWFRYEEDRDAWVEQIRDYFNEVRRSGVDPGGFE